MDTLNGAHAQKTLSTRMAEATLRRLSAIGSFTVLQEKVDKWLDDYKINTVDQNVSRGCEIIELNARVQGQLFKLLGSCASDGGLYGGASVLKTRLLPWLGQGYIAGSSASDVDALVEVASKNREIGELTDHYERSLRLLESDLKESQNESEELKAALDSTSEELTRTSRASTTDKMFADQEVNDLRRKLDQALDDNRELKVKLGILDDYERQIRNLKDEVAILSGTRSSLLRTPVPKPEPPKIVVTDSNAVDESLSTYRYIPRASSPLSIDHATQRVRQDGLIGRLADMYASDRVDAMGTLARYTDDNDNNQKIIFTALTEAFAAAKAAFRHFKIKVRSNLAVTHRGPDTLEEAVQDYINRHTDLYDLPGLVSDVIRALNRNYRISLVPDVSYVVIQPFIREACRLAWGMAALAHPLDLAVATTAELFDDQRYRRSYDSEYSAPLVHHHVWPCLMQGAVVIVKGEAVTRRGSSMSRSQSPAVRLAIARARSRSPSPRRAITNGTATEPRSSSLSATRTGSRAGSRTGSRGRADASSRVASSLKSTTLPSSLFSDRTSARSDVY